MKAHISLAAILALCCTLAGPVAARADQSDSGLEKRFALSLGYYEASTFELFSPSITSHGLAAKLDYSFFRPTRHEAVATIWYLSGKSGSFGETLFVGTAEYRWRFGGHGKAYWATGLGAGSGSGGDPGFRFPKQSSAFLTTGLGVDLGGLQLEMRSLFGNGGSISLFFLGTRF